MAVARAPGAAPNCFRLADHVMSPLLMWLSAPEFGTMIRPYRAPNGSGHCGTARWICGRCLDCRDLQGDLRRIRVISSGRTISHLPAGKVIEWRAPVQRRFANTLTNSA